ncbi:MAG: hypothetical protein IKY86_01660 [Clostridia bacterium]|nr:hypothetical protein [Clostridia bacterium]
MSDNLVKTLREKTEEADLDTVLKTSFGGYTRKSVREYIAVLRQQQRDMQQSFLEELQLYQDERERLIRELEETRQQMEDTLSAQERLTGLEKDMEEAIVRIQDDAARLEQLERELEEQKNQAQQLRGEREELLARVEAAEAQLLAPKQAQDAKTDRPTLQAEPAARPVAEPQMGQAVLMEQPETMQIQLAMLTRERETSTKRLERVIRQEKRLFEALNECQTELESRREQNLCMEAENKALSLRLSEQMWQNISLNREITHMRTMNENLKCKLEAALAQSAKCDAGAGAQEAGDLFLWDFEA